MEARFLFPHGNEGKLLLSKLWVAFPTQNIKKKIKHCIRYIHYMTGRRRLLRHWLCFRCCTEHCGCIKINCLFTDKSALEYWSYQFSISSKLYTYIAPYQKENLTDNSSLRVNSLFSLFISQIKIAIWKDYSSQLSEPIRISTAWCSLR